MSNSLQRDRRLYPEAPVAGVGAVVIKDGRMLMVKRGKEPYKRKWRILSRRTRGKDSICIYYDMVLF